MLKDLKDFKVTLNFELGIDQDTADLALKVVNMYCNQRHARIAEEIVSHESDETVMSFEDKHDGCPDCDAEFRRDYVCYTSKGEEKQMNYCPTCGRRVRY